MSKITFEQLLARREQREQDKYRVGLLTIPGAGEGLEARTPDKGAILQLYGELTAAQTPLEGLECGRHALYLSLIHISRSQRLDGDGVRAAVRWPYRRS